MGRKLGVNVMADDGNLQFHSLVFRSGWQVKNMHSAFDYIFNTHRKDNFCAKVLAEWTTKINGEYSGGIPPTTDDIKTNTELVLDFIGHLFIKQPQVVLEVRKLLVGSILRWHDEFNELLDLEPSNKYERKNNHPFVERLEKALTDSGVTTTILTAWKKEIIESFNNKNWMAIPLKDFLTTAGESARVDTRSLSSQLSDMTSRYNEIVRLHHKSEERMT